MGIEEGIHQGGLLFLNRCDRIQAGADKPDALSTISSSVES